LCRVLQQAGPHVYEVLKILYMSSKFKINFKNKLCGNLDYYMMKSFTICTHHYTLLEW
jgi:hypothetical protein